MTLPVYAVRVGTDDMGTQTFVFNITEDEDPRIVAQDVADDLELPLLDWGLVADYVGRDLYELVTI